MCFVIISHVAVVEILYDINLRFCDRIIRRCHDHRAEDEAAARGKRVHVCIERLAQNILFNSRAAEDALIVLAAVERELPSVLIYRLPDGGVVLGGRGFFMPTRYSTPVSFRFQIVDRRCLAGVTSVSAP